MQSQSAAAVFLWSCTLVLPASAQTGGQSVDGPAGAAVRLWAGTAPGDRAGAVGPEGYSRPEYALSFSFSCAGCTVSRDLS